MSAKGNDSLSAKERALIEAAQQSITAKGTQAAVPAPKPTPASASRATSAPAQPATRPTTPVRQIAAPPALGAAERIALLMQAEREQTEARKRKLRLWGIYIPMAVLGLLVLWTGVTTLRQVFS